MDIITPTATDDMKNRLKEFTMFGTAQFLERAAIEILIAFDKNNVKADKCTKYLAKFVDLSATGLSVAGGLGPMAKGIHVD